MHSSVVEGIILKDLNYHDWKFNVEHKCVEAIGGEVSGEERAPMVVFRMRRLNNTKKEEEEVEVAIPIRKTTLATNHYGETLLTLQFYCNSVYPEFYLRNNAFIV
jgi:hypothetical protein